MTGGFIRGRVLVPSLLVGMLVAFFVWSIGWTLQGREGDTYRVSKSHAVVTVRPPYEVSDAEALTAEVTNLLRRHKQALVIAPTGEGRPGLAVIDPTGVIPWTGARLEPGERPQLLVFAGSYCAGFSTNRTPCPLAPDNAEVVSTITPDFDIDTLQYAYAPALGEPLPKGRYILTSSDPGLVQELIEVLSPHGYQPGGVYVPDLWHDLLYNPLIDMSALLCLGGVVAASIYWRSALRGRATELQVRVQAGGTATQIVQRALMKTAWEPVLGPACGAALSLALTSGLARTSPPPGVLWWLAIAVPLTATLLLVLLAALTHRQAVVTAKGLAHG